MNLPPLSYVWELYQVRHIITYTHTVLLLLFQNAQQGAAGVRGPDLPPHTEYNLISQGYRKKYLKEDEEVARRFLQELLTQNT